MKRGLFLFFVFYAISNTYASTDCLQRPSCEELGYVQQKARCACLGKEVLPCPFDIKNGATSFCGDFPPKKEACSPEFCAKAMSFFNGQKNTKAIVDQLGKEALAAYAATQFYVGDKDGDFGQGTWYLPAIGEMMEMFGTDFSKVTELRWESGVTDGSAGYRVQSTLKQIYGYTYNMPMGWHFSSSETAMGYVFGLKLITGTRESGTATKNTPSSIILFHFMKDFFKTIPDAPDEAPRLGDIVYTDKSYSRPNKYDRTKTPAGVIVYISEDCRDVKIISLGNLRFSSTDTIDNFDPEKPFTNNKAATMWTTNEKVSEDITGVTNYSGANFLEICHGIADCSCDFWSD